MQVQAVKGIHKEWLNALEKNKYEHTQRLGIFDMNYNLEGASLLGTLLYCSGEYGYGIREGMIHMMDSLSTYETERGNYSILEFSSASLGLYTTRGHFTEAIKVYDDYTITRLNSRQPQYCKGKYSMLFYSLEELNRVPNASKILAKILRLYPKLVILEKFLTTKFI